MRRISGVLLVLSFAVLGLVPVVAPAQAEGNGMPVLAEPVDGALVHADWPRLNVDVTSAASGDYQMDLACEVGTAHWEFTHVESVGTTRRFWLPDGLEGQCQVTIARPSDGGVSTSSFRFVRGLIASPVEAQLPYGWRGPFAIDLSSLPDGPYVVSLWCRVGGDQEWSVDKTTGTGTVKLDSSVYLAGWCELAVASAGSKYYLDRRTFTIGTPRVSAGMQSGPFYPLYRDGHLDDVSMYFTVNRPAAASITVLDSADRPVRNLAMGNVSAGTHKWLWDGRRDDGSTAPVGTYRLRVSVEADGMTATTHTNETTVATGFYWARAWVVRRGGQGTPVRRGSCWVSNSAGRVVSTLHCRGGRTSFARMTYGFRLPPSARNIALYTRGHYTKWDRCCHGRIRTWGTRPSATLFRSHARIAGTRDYRVLDVSIAYDYRRYY